MSENVVIILSSWFMPKGDVQVYHKVVDLYMPVRALKWLAMEVFEICRIDITKYYLIDPERKNTFFSTIRNNLENARKMLSHFEDLSTHPKKARLKDISVSSGYVIFFDLKGTPVTIDPLIYEKYMVKKFYVIFGDSREAIIARLAQRTNLPQRFLIIKDEMKDLRNPINLDIDTEARRNVKEGLCQFALYLSLFQSSINLADVITDYLVIYGFYQLGEYYFMGSMIFFKLLNFIIRVVRHQKRWGFFLSIINSILHFDIYLQGISRWCRASKELTESEVIQSLCRNLPNLVIQVYALFYNRTFGTVSLVSAALSLVSISMLFVRGFNHLEEMYEQIYLPTMTKRDEGNFYKFLRFLLNLMEAYWKITLLALFSIYARPYGFWIFVGMHYLFLMISLAVSKARKGCCTMIISSVGLGFVFTLLEVSFYRPFNFLYSSAITSDYVENFTTREIKEDFVKISLNNFLRIFQGLLYINWMMLFDENNIWEAQDYKYYFLVALGCFGIIIFKYLHDLFVIFLKYRERSEIELYINENVLVVNNESSSAQFIFQSQLFQT